MMDRHGPSRRIVRLLAAPLMMVGGLAALAPAVAASAAPCVRVTGLQPPSPGLKTDALEGVASFNGCNAWAVGGLDGGTFIEHWDGAEWHQVSSPAPGSDSNLVGVNVVSPGNAWAVGTSLASSGGQTLIEHWNGTSWSAVPSPNPGGSNVLSGVASASASNVWAVGEFIATSSSIASPSIVQALIEHWDGSSWSVVPSPTPSTSTTVLNSVAATSASDVWAVGSNIAAGSSSQQTLIEHWNGTSWSVVPSPGSGTGPDQLFGVTATSASDAWAVGFTGNGTSSQPLIEHWDGTSWTVVTVPSLATGQGMLLAVTANGARNAFAVGEATTVTGGNEKQTPILLRWDGSSWAQVNLPSLGDSSAILSSVSASSQDVWMTGDFNTDTTPTQAMAFHCC